MAQEFPAVRFLRKRLAAAEREGGILCLPAEEPESDGQGSEQADAEQSHVERGNFCPGRS